MNFHRQVGLSLSPLSLSSGTDWFYLKTKQKTRQTKRKLENLPPPSPCPILIPKVTWVSPGQEQYWVLRIMCMSGGRTEEARLRGCLASFTLGQAWGQGRGCCMGLWANHLLSAHLVSLFQVLLQCERSSNWMVVAPGTQAIGLSDIQR